MSEQWRGVPITELYGSQSPWGVPEFPLIAPSFNHAVLYHISSTGDQTKDRPPKPQIGHDKWDQDHVRMPCSSHSLYPVEENGKTKLKKRWDIIQEALNKPISNTDELCDAILSYNTKFKNYWKFRALRTLFNSHLEEEEAEYFFNVTLPEIAKLALALPKLIQSPIPLLKQHKNKAILLSQLQISSLLANAFFCTFPRRNTTKRTSEYASYPHINFNTLYESSGSEAVLEKLKCICHYFRRVCTKVPVGVMTFMRRSVPPRHCPDWADSTRYLGSIPLHVNSDGTIEDDGLGLIQVDFANKYLGGGVLNRGSVQEEIRFVICPELLLSMLFTEVLRPNEALLMIGCERYSKYSGYGHTFQWAGDYSDQTPHDSSGRRRCAVLAIDALPFASKAQEYRRENIIRELNKAWVGMSFYVSPDEETKLQYPGVATGNWGCGAFGGSTDLKSLLQLMAASVAGRPIAYYTFGDADLRNNIINMYNLLAKHNVTVGELYKYILSYSTSNVIKSQLYAFIQQALIDKDNAKPPDPMDISGSSQECLDRSDAVNSPDLFSQEDDEKPEIDPKKVKKDPELNSETNMTSDTSEDSDLPKNLEAKITEIDNMKAHTLRLFEEMEKIDDASGCLNFKERKHRISLNESVSERKDINLENITTSTESTKKVAETKVSIENDDELLCCNFSPDVKKKISKKITDYFAKKP